MKQTIEQLTQRAEAAEAQVAGLAAVMRPLAETYALYERVHVELDEGREWAAIEHGLRSAHTYESWLAYMTQRIVLGAQQVAFALTDTATTAARHDAEVAERARREALEEVRDHSEAPGPVYKAVERILDEESAWIARPSPEVTKRIALAATIAAFVALEDSAKLKEPGHAE